jgi:hypothetical protein
MSTAAATAAMSSEALQHATRARHVCFLLVVLLHRMLSCYSVAVYWHTNTVNLNHCCTLVLTRNVTLTTTTTAAHQ